MPYDNSWLAHYGISGQRWGVRRFQNLDRTRTEEGKLRYRESLGREFEQTEKQVKEKSSNRYSNFVRKRATIDEIRKRGKLSAKEAVRCSSIANRIFGRSSSVEPQITRDVVSCVAQSGCKMFGLENRLKQPGSLAAKIGQEANEKNVSFERAAESINDSIRYTSISNERDYVSNYESIKQKLSELGYQEIKCRNYFDMYRIGKVQHKSVQCIFTDRDGNHFELQFHTPSSQAAKELKIPLYEEARETGISEVRKASLELQMHDLAERIKDPRNVYSIRSYG